MLFAVEWTDSFQVAVCGIYFFRATHEESLALRMILAAVLITTPPDKYSTAPI